MRAFWPGNLGRDLEESTASTNRGLLLCCSPYNKRMDTVGVLLGMHPSSSSLVPAPRRPQRLPVPRTLESFSWNRQQRLPGNHHHHPRRYDGACSRRSMKVRRGRRKQPSAPAPSCLDHYPSGWFQSYYWYGIRVVVVVGVITWFPCGRSTQSNSSAIWLQHYRRSTSESPCC